MAYLSDVPSDYALHIVELRMDVDQLVRHLYGKKGDASNGTALGKLFPQNILIVIPAKAGIQRSGHHWCVWIPSFAGMTVLLSLRKYHSLHPLYC